MRASEPRIAVSGVVAFYGGGAFERNDDLDRRLLAEVAADRVVMLPTADAFEQPAVLVATATAWAQRLGVDLEALMVMQRQDADDGAAAAIDTAPAVYLAGDSSMHLRSVLKDTVVFAALLRVLERGGLVVAIGPSAAALSDPMFDVRGGGFTLGLGLETGVAIIPETEKWSEEALGRTRSLATTPLIALPTGSAAVSRGGRWQLIGSAQASGDLRVEASSP
jgi:cyanophycinase